MTNPSARVLVIEGDVETARILSEALIASGNHLTEVTKDDTIVMGVCSALP